MSDDLNSLLAPTADGGIDIVTLATRFLRFCRDNAEALRAALNDASRLSSGRALRLAARDTFEEIDSEWIDRVELKRVTDLLLDAASLIGAVLAVRYFADGLDLALGERFAGPFAGRELELSPHCAIPIRFSAVSIIQGALNGNPSKRTARFDELDHLRLAPADLRGISISASWTDSEDLAPLAFKKTTRFAVGITNKSLEEFGLRRYEVDGTPVFFDVKAKDPDQTKTISSILRVAGAEGIDVLVLPELCLTSDSADHVRGWRRSEEGGRTPLIVAGSLHIGGQEGEAGTNESLTFLGVKEFRHRKFRPFLFEDNVAEDGETILAAKIERTEHLRPITNQFTVHYSGDWSFTVLICKDVLDLATQELLRAVAVQLVLIPAMSASTQELHDVAGLLAADPQAVTVIANIGPVNGIVGTPRRISTVVEAAGEAKSLVILDTSGGAILLPCSGKIQP